MTTLAGLKLARPSIVSHPAFAALWAEAKNHYRQSVPQATDDQIADWLCEENNWNAFISRCDQAGMMLTPGDRVNPKSSPAVITGQHPFLRRNTQEAPRAAPPPVIPTPGPKKSKAFARLLDLGSNMPARLLGRNAAKSKPAPNPVAPWNRPPSEMAPAKLFHEFIDSAGFELSLRGYDIVTNAVGFHLLAVNTGMQGIGPEHELIFFAAAIAISIMEIIALWALAKAITISRKPKTGDLLIDLPRMLGVWIFGLLFVVAVLMWFVDLAMSVYPWYMWFNGNVVGLLIGIVLSVLTEAVEINAHLKTLDQYVQRAADAAKTK